eukprot:407496_1
MGYNFEILRDYYSLCAVFATLNSNIIKNCCLISKYLSQKDIQKLNEWQVLFNIKSNYKSFRLMFRRCITNNKAYIIHVGMLLNDLQEIYFENSDDCGLMMAPNCECIMNKCVDKNDISMNGYNKLVRIAVRIQQFVGDENNKYENMNVDKYFYKIMFMEFEKIKNITEEELVNMSIEIVAKNEQEELDMIKEMTLECIYNH